MNRINKLLCDLLEELDTDGAYAKLQSKNYSLSSEERGQAKKAAEAMNSAYLRIRDASEILDKVDRVT